MREHILQAYNPTQKKDDMVRTPDVNTLQNKNISQNKDLTKTIENVGGQKGLVKVLQKQTSIALQVPQKDSIYRQVAKFLVLIGKDEAAKVLPHLTPVQIEKIVPEIASIRHIDEDEATTIFAQFDALLKQAKEDGGVETARTILEKAFGKEKATQMIEKTVAFPEGKPFEYLKDVGIDRISLLLQDESSATKALVLSQLEPKKAADLIGQMEDEAKKEVVLRLAKMKAISPEVLKRVDCAMQEKLKSFNIENATKMDGRGVLASILRQMSIENEENILQNISHDNIELEKDLRSMLFTTEDIIQGDDVFIQKTLRAMQDIDIVFLIAGKSQDFRSKILSNVSQNRKNDILEKEDIEKPFKKTDCQKTTSNFLNKLYEAFQKGDFVIEGRCDDEYV